MYIFDIEFVIKNLVDELDLKNEAELADKLIISKNALSMLKKRKSLGTLIEKVLFHIDEKISLDKIIYGDNSNCFKAKELAYKNNNLEEFNIIIDDFIEKNIISSDIKNIIEKIKGQTFFQKFLEQFNNKGEKKLKLLYYFLDNIEKNQKIFNLSNIKYEFIVELEKFELNHRKKFLSFEINKYDKQSLIAWVKNELDDVAIFEIIQNITELKKVVLNNLNIFDKVIVKL